MKITPRPIYLNRIISQLNKGMMLVLVGQRRVGKSFMLKQLHQWLKENKPGAEILFIDKDIDPYDNINDGKSLLDFAAQHFKEGGDNYLLIDEVQDIEDYETALRSLYARELCQIVVTGSNAYIFSSEIATKFSGRYIEIPIYSLGYEEFLIFHNLENNSSSLTKYLTFGGMPGLANYSFDNPDEIIAYLQGIYNTVIVKDIVAREQIRNFSFLERLIAFIADNTGQPVSINSITKYLKAQGAQVSNDLASRYLKSICNSLVVDQVERYDIHGKKLFDYIGKYYFSDHGIRNCIANAIPGIFGSIEKIMESVVRHHLLVCRYNVRIGIIPSGEVDFVATRGQETIYVQVCYKLSDPATITREFGNLKAIGDDFPKYVVTMEEIVGPLKDYPGIIHIGLREFLSKKL